MMLVVLELVRELVRKLMLKPALGQRRRELGALVWALGLVVAVVQVLQAWGGPTLIG